MRVSLFMETYEGCWEILHAAVCILNFEPRRPTLCKCIEATEMPTEENMINSVWLKMQKKE